MTTFARYVKPLRSRLLPQLADYDTWARVDVAALQLPGTMENSMFGLECPLSGNRSVDLLICLTDPDQASRAFAGHRLEPLLSRWTGDGSVTSLLANLWLEFDTAKVPGMPNVFAGPAPPYFTAAHADAARLDHLQRFLTDVRGEPLAASVWATAAACLAAAPPGARAFQWGVMLGRPDRQLRLCLGPLAPSSLPAYLATIGLRSAWADLERSMSLLAETARAYAVDLDLGPSAPGERVGIEIYPHHPATALLEGLQQAGLCAPERRAVLADWTAIKVDDDGGTAAVRTLTRGRVVPVVRRTIHHCKLQRNETGETTAKIYLAVERDWHWRVPAC